MAVSINWSSILNLVQKSICPTKIKDKVGQNRGQNCSHP